jgi:hypothetical protein
MSPATLGGDGMTGNKIENISIDQSNVLSAPIAAIAEAIGKIADANKMLAEAVKALSEGIGQTNVTGLKIESPPYAPYFPLPDFPDDYEEEDDMAAGDDDLPGETPPPQHPATDTGPHQIPDVAGETAGAAYPKEEK